MRWECHISHLKVDKNENNSILIITPFRFTQIVFAAQTLALYATSKIAKENFEVFADAWAGQINDLSILVKDVNDVCQGRVDRQVYLSLPRPGVCLDRPLLVNVILIFCLILLIKKLVFSICDIIIPTLILDFFNWQVLFASLDFYINVEC